MADNVNENETLNDALVDYAALKTYTEEVKKYALKKTEYEYSLECDGGTEGALYCLGQHYVGDSTINIDISSSCNGQTCAGQLVISVVNGGVVQSLYGQTNDALIKKIFIHQTNKNGNYCTVTVLYELGRWEKALFHLQSTCNTSKVPENIGSISVSKTGTQIAVTNVLLTKFSEYYTSAEVDNKLKGKSDTGHGHDLNSAALTNALPVTKGGTGATDAKSARSNLGITPGNIGAAQKSHAHALADISLSIEVKTFGTGEFNVVQGNQSLYRTNIYTVTHSGEIIASVYQQGKSSYSYQTHPCVYITRTENKDKYNIIVESDSSSLFVTLVVLKLPS